VADQLGRECQRLRRWVRRASRGRRLRAGPATEERQRSKDLEPEDRELEGANGILRRASAFFPQAVIARRPKYWRRLRTRGEGAEPICRLLPVHPGHVARTEALPSRSANAVSFLTNATPKRCDAPAGERFNRVPGARIGMPSAIPSSEHHCAPVLVDSSGEAKCSPRKTAVNELSAHPSGGLVRPV